MRATDFVQSYFNAWNHHDPVAVADHLAFDGLYCDVPDNAVRSHDELIVALEEFFSAYHHRYELVGDILERPHAIAFQYRMYPLGQDRKNGSNAMRGAEFIELHGNAAASIYDYYDIPDTGRAANSSTLRSLSVAKYAKSGLSDGQLEDYKARLNHVMREEQAYLESDLTLPRLAALVGCSVNHLSQVINAGFRMGFYDYLNHFRVEHAKALLSELEGRGHDILRIAFTVGFNSNSAFYAAFKKYVGETPAQFRRARNRRSPTT